MECQITAGGMAGKVWTEEERRVMRNMYPHYNAQVVADQLKRSVKSVYARATVMGLRKSDEFLSSEQSGRISRMRQLGRDRRFKKGQIPKNKGVRWTEWMSPEGMKNSLTTAFKRGNAPHNTKYDGCVATRRDTTTGREYKYIRLEKGKWMQLHRVVWIFLNGPIPADKILRCLTDDTLNCDPSNWFLTDRKTNLAKNSGRETMSDKYIALVLARRDHQLRDALMQMPEVLDLKRTELTLKNTIDGIAC